VGLGEIPHRASDGYGKAAIAKVLTVLYITRTSFLARLATPAILPPTLTRQQSSLGKVMMALPEHFRFLGIALYGFLHCQLL